MSDAFGNVAIITNTKTNYKSSSTFIGLNIKFYSRFYTRVLTVVFYAQRDQKERVCLDADYNIITQSFGQAPLEGINSDHLLTLTL